MVNSKYFPNKGIASDVGGIISASNRKNTVSDTKIEMLNDIYEKRKNNIYLKCTLSMQTVTQTLSETSIIVNSRYFPSKGIARDVGGIISARPRKNTVRDTRMEMQSDI